MTLVQKTSRHSDRLEPTGDSQPNPGRTMTEREFECWVDDKTRAEWADGEVIVIPPDSLENDDLGFWVRAILQDFVEARELGRVAGPNFTVRLPGLRRRRLPDVLFVARGREQLIKPTFVEGPPDLIVEVVAPESVARDWREKYLEYERAGVREYWVIDRQNERVEAYSLMRKRYRPIELRDGRICSTVLAGFFLKPEWLVRTPLMSRRKALAELGV